MKSKDQRDLFPGALEMMVLTILQARPLHGYAIAQTIKRTSKDLLLIEEGSLYPALQRMLNAGWLKAGWGLSARNRRVFVYRITAKGRKQLESKVSSFERMLEAIQLVMNSSRENVS
jgi:transcriptional regulator